MMILKYLALPYPFDSSWRKHFIQNALIGCFIAFFLIVFQPFNTNIWHDKYKTIKLIGFGVIAFLVPMMLVAVQFLRKPPEEVEEKWSVGKEIIYMLLTFVLIAFLNMIYSNWLGVSQFGIRSFLGFILPVVTLGVFPLTAGILLRYNQFKNMNQKAADVLIQNIQEYQSHNEKAEGAFFEKNNTVTLIAENEKDTLSLSSNDLLYIESADNYSNIVFFKNNRIQKELLRGALKRFENQLSQPLIQRCHRSFIVNLHHVENISGNAQGYRIQLKNCEEVIPVARNYGATILSILKG